eukprot:600918-Amorphochlora_amoeboformis.AAC.1
MHLYISAVLECYKVPEVDEVHSLKPSVIPGLVRIRSRLQQRLILGSRYDYGMAVEYILP